MFRVKTEIAPEVSRPNEPHYNFRSKANHFKRDSIKSTDYDTQSVQYLEPQVRSLVPQNIRKCNSPVELIDFQKI